MASAAGPGGPSSTSFDIDKYVDALCEEYKDNGVGHKEAALKVIRDASIPDTDKGHVLNAYWTRRNVRILILIGEWLFILFRFCCPHIDEWI